MISTTRQFAADSHTGLHRNQNEDCYEADADLDLWLIADGVGGHSCGEVASSMARETVRESIAGGKPLLEAVRCAHEAILNAADDGLGARGMGSTIVAAHLEQDNYEVTWVGDSRAYVFNSDLRQITSDHNRAGELLANNAITPEQASSHPERHILTQSLGVSADNDIDPGYQRGKFAPGESLLLCSDGLTDEISDSLIKHLLADHETPRAQVDALMSAALDSGGKDNITVVIVSGAVSSDDSLRAEDADSSHSFRRSASGGRPNDGKFPVRAFVLLCILALLAVALLT